MWAAQSRHSNPSGPRTIRSRAKRACDICHARKIKCDQRVPCSGCAQISAPCTNDRPETRRGPPNKHALAALKRQSKSPVARDDEDLSLSLSSSPIVSPTLAKTPCFLSPPEQVEPGITALCPFETVLLLVADYFAEIHPLIPTVHKPTVLSRLEQRDDLHSASFQATLASMLTLLLASIPKKFYSYGLTKLYTSSMHMADKCHEMAIAARGVNHQDRVTVESAAISYALFLSSGYMFNNRMRMRMLMAESLCAIRILRLHRKETYEGGPRPGWNYVDMELGKRVFWCCNNTIRTMQQFQSMDDILLPNELTSYPPLPLEVDDEYIYADHIEHQPQHIVSSLTGFNINASIYLAFSPLPLLESSFAFAGVDLLELKNVLEGCLDTMRSILEDIPEVLSIKAPESPYLTRVLHHIELPIKYEVQKANIYTTHLCTRSFLVEKYARVLNSIRQQENTESGGREGTSRQGTQHRTPENPDGIDLFEDVPPIIASERDEIVKELLYVLSHICQAGMEPNGRAVIAKIRQVATTILPSANCDENDLNTYPKQYLMRVLEVLSKLEQIDDEIYDCPDGANVPEGEPDIPHTESTSMFEMGQPTVTDSSRDHRQSSDGSRQRWAELRERQVAFIQQVGGFI